jgi:hypothetical protein
MLNDCSTGNNPRKFGITFLAIISGVIFLVSLVVHLATFVSPPSVSMESMWFIHLAIFVPFGSMVIIASVRQRKNIKNEKMSLMYRYINQYVEGFEFIKRIFRTVPRPALIIGIILAIYIPINFILFIGRSLEGSPHEDDGRYYLSDHGTYVRELTEEEYIQYQAYEVRGFSGHWMIFSYIPLVYFGFIHDKMKERPSDTSTYSEVYKSNEVSL